VTRLKRNVLALALAVSLLTTVSGLAALAPPAGAAAPSRQFPLVSPVTYLIDGLYQNHFTASAPVWADNSWKVDGLQGLWSLAAAAGDNYRYITSGDAASCGTNGGAVACSYTNNLSDTGGNFTGCIDNNVSFPYSCRIVVIWDPSRINWYQGQGQGLSGTQDLWGTLVHEKGHWAGCFHSSIALESDGAATPTMTNAGDGYAGRTPQQDDINCVKGARLGGNRNIAANGTLDPGRIEWGGFNHLTWNVGGTGGTGPTTGFAVWGSNYGVNHGGNQNGVQLISGSDATGPINLHQVLSDLGSDPGKNAWFLGRPRSANAAVYEGGVVPFFINIIVTDGPAGGGGNNPTVLANTYCNFTINAWTTCATPYFTSLTGTYMVSIYNGSQRASGVLGLDDLNVVIQ